MIAIFGRVVARTGIKQQFPKLGKSVYFLTDTDMASPVLNKTIKEFQNIPMK